MAPKSEAASLLQKAEKKASSSTGWFGSSKSKYEEAGDLFQSAANRFKLENSFVEAGDAFSKEAECREKSDFEYDAANAWWNASKAYKQAGRPDLATDALGQTINFLTKQGKFRQAADREKDIATICLQRSVEKAADLQRDDLARACESYERAAQWYKQEDALATASGCLKDAADLRAQLEHWDRAIALYEEVSKWSLTNATTRYSVKEYWLREGICLLAKGDATSAKRNLGLWTNEDPTFARSREAKFLEGLIEAVLGGDSQAFATICFEYDQVSQLDKLKTAILRKVKDTIDEEPDLR